EEERIVVLRGAAEDSDLALDSRGVVAGAFEGFPGALQKEPLLRIGVLGFAPVEAEEAGVPEIRSFEHAAGRHHERLLTGGRSPGPVFGEVGDGLDSVPQVAPERFWIARA